MKKLYNVPSVTEINRNLRSFFRNQFQMIYRFFFSLYYFKNSFHTCLRFTNCLIVPPFLQLTHNKNQQFKLAILFLI